MTPVLGVLRNKPPFYLVSGGGLFLLYLPVSQPLCRVLFAQPGCSDHPDCFLTITIYIQFTIGLFDCHDKWWMFLSFAPYCSIKPYDAIGILVFSHASINKIWAFFISLMIWCDVPGKTADVLPDTSFNRSIRASYLEYLFSVSQRH